MRVFVAIDLSAEVRARIEKLEDELRARLPRARFVPARNLHLTLRFLGETQKELVDSMALRLTTRIPAISGFVLNVRGCGAFPDAKRARVLWVSVDNPPDGLFALQSAIEQIAQRAGFAPEKQRFAPHFTVARFREPAKGLETTLRAVADRELGTIRVDEVVVYESRLFPKETTYAPLHRFRLGSGTELKGLV